MLESVFICQKWKPILFVIHVEGKEAGVIKLLNISPDIVLGDNATNCLQLTNSIIHAFVHLKSRGDRYASKHPLLCFIPSEEVGLTPHGVPQLNMI